MATKIEENAVMTKIIGILNVTPNSFSDGGVHNSVEGATTHYKKLLGDGANFVDVGAQATSYGAKLIEPEEELQILKPVLNSLKATGVIQKASIDTFNHKTAKHAIGEGVSIVNDVCGGKSPAMLELLANSPGVKYVCMFSVSIPARKDLRVDSFQAILDWIGDSVSNMKAHGIREEQIIVDPGIGFATGPALSFETLNKIDELKSFGYPVMIGASRKTFITNIADIEPIERDLETTLISCYLRRKGVEYIRVHNVNWHKRAFNMMRQFGK